MDNQKIGIIAVVVVIIIIVVVVLLIALSGTNTTTSTSTVDPVIIYDVSDYYADIPAGSTITMTSSGDTPLGGTTINFVNYASTLTANSTFTLSSSYSTRLRSKHLITATVSSGLVKLVINVVPNLLTFNQVTLTSQGYLNASNGVSFAANTPVYLGAVENDTIPNIASENTTLTLAYNL